MRTMNSPPLSRGFSRRGGWDRTAVIIALGCPFSAGIPLEREVLARIFGNESATETSTFEDD
jgi:hypothetical protein